MSPLRKYPALFRAAWAVMIEYRAEIIVYMLTSVWIVILLMVWLSVAEGGSIAGYAPDDYVSYYMVLLFCRNMTAVWASYELDTQIRQGTLSPKLLRPMHPVHHEVAANLAEKGIRAVMVVPIVTVVFALLPHAPLDVRLPTLLLFALSLAGAWLITFFADYLLGMLGFWTSQSIAFVQAFFVLRMLFSGVLAPLAMFPSGIHAALQWLPFRYMLSFPVEVLTGRWVHPDLLQGFVVQWLWAGALLLATVLLWRRAMRAYGAVGA